MNKTILSILFPTNYGKWESLLLLASRVVFAFLLTRHGMDKLLHYSEMSSQFPAMLGMSSSASLAMAIFGELVCAIGVIVGLFTRPALFAMVINMGVAFFMAHGGSIAEGELAFLYFLIYIVLLIAGPGHCSFDYIIGKKLAGNK